MADELQFEYDETKRQQVIKERGIDFLYAAFIFEGPTLTVKDERENYGEDRFVSLGMVEDEYFIVVYTQRNGVIRLITAWKGGRHEKERYEKAFRD